MLEKELLDKMAKVKAEVQRLQFWVDDATTDRIAHIRYEKVKDRLKGLVAKHKSLMREWLEERVNAKE